MPVGELSFTADQAAIPCDDVIDITAVPLEEVPAVPLEEVPAAVSAVGTRATRVRKANVMVGSPTRGKYAKY